MINTDKLTISHPTTNTQKSNIFVFKKNSKTYNHNLRQNHKKFRDVIFE